VSPRLAPYVFSLLVSGTMSCIVSGVSTWRAGVESGFLSVWLTEAWPLGWGIAYPTLLCVAPVARRLVAAVTRPAP